MLTCKFCGDSCLMSGYDHLDNPVWECSCGKFMARIEGKKEKNQKEDPKPKMVRTKNGSLCEVYERNGPKTILKFGNSYFYYDIALCTEA